MKVYCQMEEGICRYLEEWNLDINLLLALGMMHLAEEKTSFWKSGERNARSILIDCNFTDYKLLFTESFQMGKYMGEIMEDRITQAFFQYICR
jgi:hypothetical protein